MKTVVIEKKKYTYEDYMKTSDDKRYELISLLSPSQYFFESYCVKKAAFSATQKSAEIIVQGCVCYQGANGAFPMFNLNGNLLRDSEVSTRFSMSCFPLGS